MRNCRNRIFIPNPSFFKNKNYGIDTYLNIGIIHNGKPMFVDIIFTKSHELEKIQQAAIEDLNTPDLLPSQFLYKQEICEHLKNGKPSDRNPNLIPKLVFTGNGPGFKLTKNLLEIHVKEDHQLLDQSKILFFPASSDNNT